MTSYWWIQGTDGTGIASGVPRMGVRGRQHHVSHDFNGDGTHDLMLYDTWFAEPAGVLFSGAAQPCPASIS